MTSLGAFLHNVEARTISKELLLLLGIVLCNNFNGILLNRLRFLNELDNTLGDLGISNGNVSLVGVLKGFLSFIDVGLSNSNPGLLLVDQFFVFESLFLICDYLICRDLVFRLCCLKMS